MIDCHPNDMSAAELLALRAVNRVRAPTVRSFTDEAGRIWNIAAGLGEPWVRVYAGYDLDARAPISQPLSVRSAQKQPVSPAIARSKAGVASMNPAKPLIVKSSHLPPAPRSSRTIIHISGR